MGWSSHDVTKVYNVHVRVHSVLLVFDGGRR